MFSQHPGLLIRDYIFELAAQAMRALVLDRDGCVPKELAAAIYFDGEGEQLRYAMSEPEIERVLYDM